MKIGKILVIDKDDKSRELLNQLFSVEFEVLQAKNVAEVLRYLNKEKAGLDLVIISCKETQEEGMKNLQIVNASLGEVEIPKVVLLEVMTQQDELDFYNAGATEVIKKPYVAQILRARVKRFCTLKRSIGASLESEQNRMKAIEARSENSNKMVDGLIEFMCNLAEYRTVERGNHIRNVKIITRAILQSYQKLFPEEEITDEQIMKITKASAFHDIGKISIPEEILLKPGKLTEEENLVMQSHTAKGLELLELIPGLKDENYYDEACDICKYHHERIDGAGYPDKLEGNAIPFSAQVVGLAESYEALISDRVYKKAYTRQNAFIMITNGNCGTFSANLIEAFKDAKDILERIGN